jgi:glycolate oxidase iron-sulfur subunit
LLGDELDGPRGRIYQIKQMLEGADPSESTQLHLDRCLTCMNCETTCPSGVRYGRLVDIGRAVVEQRVPRTPRERWRRGLLRFALTRRWIFGPAVQIGRAIRALVPEDLRSKLPQARAAGELPHRTHTRKVLLLNGCVQPALVPAIDAATARVLDALGVEALVESSSGCCGAIDYHLTAHDAAKQRARRNIDAWWPHIERGAEALVINASGCGAMVKDYAQLLGDDSKYAVKAERVSGMTRDLAEFLAPLVDRIAEIFPPSGATSSRAASRIAFHPPCTLQHTQKLKGVTEALLSKLGAELVPVTDSHLCCGAAGPYSLLQAELSQKLRANKLDNLQRGHPDMILSANIGCLTHLETGVNVPVRHWIEWVDERMRR